MPNIEKAIEISNAKIQFVSLVDKAANKRQFLITKADGGKAQFSTAGKILKFDDTTHYVTGIVYEPLVEDTHGNFMTEEEIRKAAYWFAKNGDKVDIQHSFEKADGIAVVENYVAPCDMKIGGTAVVKGTWIMTAEVQNDEVWEKVQKGEVTGFSMGGVGVYAETDTDLSATVEKKGVFKRLAGMLGFDVVEKGEVADRFTHAAKSNNFWAARNALDDTLQFYNRITDRWEFETDETKIREALTEFSNIVMDILAMPNILKAFEEKPVEKAGKKLSGKNRETLQTIYESLGGLLSAVADKNKEESEVNKTEIQEIIAEEIKKHLAPATEAKTDPITEESVQKMIDAAVQKALTPQNEPLTADSVADMIQKAAATAVEPVLKARGIACNLMRTVQCRNRNLQA